MAKRTKRIPSAVSKPSGAGSGGGDKTPAPNWRSGLKCLPTINQIAEWQWQLSERAVDVFGGTTVTDPSVALKVLHAKIGKLMLENDFLESALTKVEFLSAKQ